MASGQDGRRDQPREAVGAGVGLRSPSLWQQGTWQGFELSGMLRAGLKIKVTSTAKLSDVPGSGPNALPQDLTGSSQCVRWELPFPLCRWRVYKTDVREVRSLSEGPTARTRPPGSRVSCAHLRPHAAPCVAVLDKSFWATVWRMGRGGQWLCRGQLWRGPRSSPVGSPREGCAGPSGLARCLRPGGRCGKMTSLA